MPTDVIMPQMGESIFEGTITKWLRKAGDRVGKDEPLFEISTDKVDAEIPSPAAGVLSEIKVPEGATVQVNTVVAVIAEIGSAAEAGAAKPQSSPPQAPLAGQPALPEAQPAPPQASSGTEVVMPQLGESIFEGVITKWLKKAGDSVEKDEPLFEISTDKVDAEIPSTVAGVLTEMRFPEGATVGINTVVAVIGGGSASVSAAIPLTAAPAATVSSVSATRAPEAQPAAPQAAARRIRSSPLVRRMARENQIDLAQVPGTGLDGRIGKEDVLRYLSRPATAGQYGTGGAALSLQPQGTGAAQAHSAPSQVVPLTRMRAIIAERMVESLRISPHVHTVYKVDMTRIARLRERLKAGFAERHGVKLTYMPFIATAAIEALRLFPIVNASLEDGAIHYHPNINLGIAVSLEWGLIVPVVRQAERLGFVDLARSIADLAARARAKKLSPDEAAGSTFTLTNNGILGEEFGTPIINQPDSAILAIGGLKKEPVVLTDAEGNDTIAIRSVQYFCLGFDHRTIDGAGAGGFMTAFKKTLESWNREPGAGA